MGHFRSVEKPINTHYTLNVSCCAYKYLTKSDVVNCVFSAYVYIKSRLNQSSILNERVCLNFGFNTNGRDCSQMNVFKLIQFRFQYFPSIWMWRKRFEFNKVPKQLFNNSSIIAEILSEPFRVRGKKQSLEWLNSNLNWTTSKIDFILREFHNQSSCVWKKWFFKKNI